MTPVSHQVALVKMAEVIREKAREVGNVMLANASLSDLIAAVEEVRRQRLLADLIERGSPKH